VLKSLTISGFKSFARPVSLEFPGGITAFVGSNGSGKSNLVDAVRWCLGEQSMRDLRGQRAEDVIYAGPRKSLGAAEVALTFDNDDPAGLWSELCIARRLYRSGESDYLLNRNKARLRDVLGVLREVGIDAARHVVVTQGMADSLLSSTPLERRALLEQAAGLSGYRERRDDARQKLETTARNIATVEIVLAELEPRVRLLRRQARAVEEREVAASRLRAASTAWYASKWHGVTRTIDETSAEVQRAAEQRADAGEELRRAELVAETSLGRERAWNHRLEVALAALHSTERDFDAATSRARQLDERLASLDDALNSLRLRGTWIEQARLEAQSRRAGVGESLSKLHAVRSEQETVQRELQAVLGRLLEESREAACEASTRRKEWKEMEKILFHRSRQREDLRRGLESAFRGDMHAERWLCESDGKLDDLAADLAGLEARRASAQEDLDREAAELSRRQDALAEQSRRLGRLERLRARGHLALSQTSGRIQSLERLLAALDRDLANTLLVSLKVEPGWEQAVVAALGEWAFASPAGRGSTALHDAQADGFTEWRAALDTHLAGGGRWADTVVTGFPPDLASPLAATILVEHATVADALWRRLSPAAGHRIGSPPVQIVTRQGDRWSALGVQREMSDGRSARYLKTKRELAALAAQHGLRGRRQERIEDAQQLSARAVHTGSEAMQAAQKAVQAARQRVLDLSERMEGAERRRAALLAEREHRIQHLTELRARRAADEDALRRLETELVQVRERTGRLDSLRQEAQRHGDELRRRVECVTQQSRDGVREIELMKAKEQVHVEQLAAADREAERLAREADDAMSAARRLMDERASLAEERSRHAQAVEELTEVVAEQKERLTQVRAQRPKEEDGGATLRRLRDRLSTIVSQHERLLAQVARQEYERAQLADDIARELQRDPRSLPDNLGQSQTDEEIRRLRSRAGHLAEADPSAIEEYRSLSERQEHLRRHVDDLKAASDTLQHIMAVADREMRTRFHGALGAVSEEFSRVFRMMLGGGSARLELMNEDAGVEVRAQLPGRRALASTAFSGGERALVASSLLFGVLRIRPTPFCILDEVDAALDETNVDRYLSVLRETSSRTQIIVVTHNRATMAVADVLYGLTMDEEGMSSVLSLRLDAFERAV